MELLQSDLREEIVLMAHEVCEQWAIHPILHRLPPGALPPVMRLIAAQHRIVEAIMRAEDLMMGAIGAAAPPRQLHMTMH